MQKLTLLQMTQNILSAMNSDEVNSITDTVESQQVAEEIRNTFYDIFSNRDIPELEGIVNLESAGSVDTPNVLIIPSNVQHIKWVKYRNYRTTDAVSFSDLEYLDPEYFIKRIVEASEGLTTPYVDVQLLS